MSAVAANATDADDQLTDPGQGVRLKVCGATTPEEIEALARGVERAGEVFR